MGACCDACAYLDLQRVLVCVVLEDELLEVQEGPLVVHTLTHLGKQTSTIFVHNFSTIESSL
jgi:hypothetical protein